jgi:thymidine kinase
MAKLKFYYGTMGAGKTTEALKTYEIYRRKGLKPLIVKPTFDDREGTFKGWGLIKSKLIPDVRPCYYVDNVMEQLYNKQPYPFGVLIVDEVQFLKPADIISLSSIVDYKDVDVICYGLKTDCRGKLFEGSAQLLAIADETKELDNLCDICGKPGANMHLRYTNDEIDFEPESIKVEKGNVKYKSVCRKCFTKEML